MDDYSLSRVTGKSSLDQNGACFPYLLMRSNIHEATNRIEMLEDVLEEELKASVAQRVKIKARYKRILQAVATLDELQEIEIAM